MAGRIITNPLVLTREQVTPPDMEKLHQVCLQVHELANRMARNVSADTHLDDTPCVRRFMSACLQGMAQKVLAIKRLGPGYVPEVGAILRVHTEAAIDFFWLLSHYCHRRADAEKIATHFFAIRARHFLSQAAQAKEALRIDTFLRDFFDEQAWDQDVEDARADAKGLPMKHDNWRVVEGITTTKNVTTEARSKRAARQVAQIANLKHAPFAQNVASLNSYAHWDAAQAQRYTSGFQDALFQRHLNNAMGFLLDVMFGVASASSLEFPDEARVLTQQIVYMST